jgi:hypothetical protein
VWIAVRWKILTMDNLRERKVIVVSWCSMVCGVREEVSRISPPYGVFCDL